MRILYSGILSLVAFLLPLSAFFGSKMKLFVEGRRDVFSKLQSTINQEKPVIWFHTASLGEYEQGVPVMEAMTKQFPNHQLVITFFSPSGYEIKKDNAFAKATTYLPLDTPSNARKFLNIARPELVFFVKYEFWPNYLFELKNRNIRTFLLSGVFRENQPFFKWHGKWMIKALDAFEHFFLQNQSSMDALKRLGYTNSTLSGDTRFDRVSHQIEMDNTLDFVDEFKGGELCLVCGSTWPEDDDVIVSYLNHQANGVKCIIAPHEINKQKIKDVQQRLNVKTFLYSEKEGKTLSEYDVLIIDTIGLLTKVYNYADVAYVGGAMGTSGLHNILEPATFGVPIIIGSNFEKFPEAKRLQQLAGLYSVSNTTEFKTILDKLLLDAKFRTQTGMIAGHFINSNTGATKTVMEYLKN